MVVVFSQEMIKGPVVDGMQILKPERAFVVSGSVTLLYSALDCSWWSFFFFFQLTMEIHNQISQSRHYRQRRKALASLEAFVIILNDRTTNPGVFRFLIIILFLRHQLLMQEQISGSYPVAKY